MNPSRRKDFLAGAPEHKERLACVEAYLWRPESKNLDTEES